jgi:hypothetical protein
VDAEMWRARLWPKEESRRCLMGKDVRKIQELKRPGLSVRAISRLSGILVSLCACPFRRFNNSGNPAFG